MLGRQGVSGTLDANVGYDTRNAAAFLDGFFGLRTGNGSLNDFNGCGSEIVFRTERDQRAAAVEDVSNELKGSGAHEAIWIDAQRDVVNSFAAVDGLGNHELFVFGPGKSRGYSCGRLRSFDGCVGDIDQKSADQGAQLFERRKLLPALVGRKHRLKRVGSGENDFGESGAVFLRDLGSEDILEFVGQFA